MSNKKFRIPHGVIVRSPRLLPMRYKVRELAGDLKMPERTLRDWLKKGAPHERDSNGQIWIIGENFAKWVDQKRVKKRERKLDDNEAYCLRCKEIVEFRSTQTRHIKGKLIHIKGECPVCSCVINRGDRLDQ